MPPKRKAPSASAHGGVGYGGAQGDTKRLLAGRKKAEKKGTSEDAARTKYLKDCRAALVRNLSKAKETDPIDSLINEREKDKVAKDLAEIFRNQTPTDWDDRKDLYNAAFDLCRTLASDVRLGIIFGEKDDPEGGGPVLADRFQSPGRSHPEARFGRRRCRLDRCRAAGLSPGHAGGGSS